MASLSDLLNFNQIAVGLVLTSACAAAVFILCRFLLAIKRHQTSERSRTMVDAGDVLRMKHVEECSDEERAEVVKDLTQAGLARQLRGTSVEIRNLMRRSDADLDVLLFDWQIISDDSEGLPLLRTAMSIRLKDHSLPDFVLRPRTLSQTIASPFSRRDVELGQVTNPYRLVGEDSVRLRELFSSDVLRYLNKRHNLCLNVRREVVVATVDNTAGRSFALDNRSGDGRVGVHDVIELQQFHDDVLGIVRAMLQHSAR